MRVLWSVLAVMALAACQGELPGDPKNTYPPGTLGGACLTGNACNSGLSCVGGVCASQDKFAACTDPEKCCTKEKMTCVGDPDGQIRCTCRDLWDCSKNPKKCDQTAPVPPGGGDWKCTWSEFSYTCTKSVPPGSPPGDNPQDLPGGGGWACTFKQAEFKWECKTESPNPTNKPDGSSVWKCKVEGDKLVCERSDAPPPPPGGGGTWKCETDKETGKTTCTKTDSGGGLPPGGGNWKCNLTSKNGVPTWVCYGTSSGGTPPGGNGWTCVPAANNQWKCEKPQDSGDYPPGGGWYSCVKGSEFNGTKCEKVPSEPTPPTPQPKPGDKCLINGTMWCDGLQYCGWGQVKCDPKTGKWETKLDANGKEILNCQELATGERPNTVCACFHFFFNPACCERPDCIVPDGSKGQICPPSKGQLCDYCNPMKSECKEPDAKCIVTNAHETFCGQYCGGGKQCPSGYQCMVVKLQGGQSTNQCVPADYSCYY